MKYATVCSGIEAPSVAWHPLGWQPVFFSQYDPKHNYKSGPDFPSRVLAHHYPDVPNLGNMEQIDGSQYNGTVDLICGGTPCQSFSVAGMRGGLADSRGNLALVFCRLVDQIRPKWVLWENVSGVLSSNRGRDFGSILGALGELGYGWTYRILDAQFFGVPQRRRRVFVVGCLGNWQRPAAVLFEPERVYGDFAAGAQQKQNAADQIKNSPSNYGEWPAKVAPTLTASFGSKMGYENQHINDGAGLFVFSAGASCISVGQIAPTLDVGKSDNVGILQGSSIRRITPREAERLQGFPDDYTKVSEKTADAPRYTALGNSMAVPVMRWLGERIQLVDSLTPTLSAA